jgi:hypothetical protein
VPSLYVRPHQSVYIGPHQPPTPQKGPNPGCSGPAVSISVRRRAPAR